MARASTIWLVSTQSLTPIIAFTVKHECVTWLEKQANPNGYRVVRMPDGQESDSWAISSKLFLENAEGAAS